MIYIASPNTHPDPGVRQQRFEDVCHYVADRMLQGAVRYGRCRSRMPPARRRTPYGQLCRRSVARIISPAWKTRAVSQYNGSDAIVASDRLAVVDRRRLRCSRND